MPCAWIWSVALLLSCTLCNGATYLGCFKTAGWNTFSKDSIGSWNVDACDSQCEMWKMPLMALSGAGDCYCSATVPTVAAQLSDTQCSSKVAGAAAVYYRHGGELKGCELPRSTV